MSVLVVRIWADQTYLICDSHWSQGVLHGLVVAVLQEIFEVPLLTFTARPAWVHWPGHKSAAVVAAVSIPS